jgi:hypothetical protein
VPLGATEIGGAGVSPMISSPSLPCTGAIIPGAATSPAGTTSVGVASAPGC